MKRKLLKAAALLALACPALAADPAGPQWGPERNIRTGDIEVYTKVSGIATAQDTYDIYAPFDGRVEELQAELFDYVTPKTLLARMVSTEMAALLDSTLADGKKQAEKRWSDVYDYTEIKPEETGIITNIYFEPKTRVNKGDRLFTVAKKVLVIGKNTEPLYSKLAEGMTANLAHVRTGEKFTAKLVNFIPVKAAPLTNRLWLEITALRDGVRIGEQFDGMLFVGRSEETMLVPRSHVTEIGGRRYLMTEIKTGLETEKETEITGHTSLYLEPAAAAAAEKDGKDKKVR